MNFLKTAAFHRRLRCKSHCLIFPSERDFINIFAYHSRYNFFSNFLCIFDINSGMIMDSVGNISQLRPILKWISLFNKAGYTATPVACGWAGAVFEVT